MNKSSILFAAFTLTLFLGKSLQAAELPPELPLWEKGSPDHAIRTDVKEQVRSHKAPPGSPSGLNRAFSFVSSPAPSICPFFIINARDDRLTPANKCVNFYATLLRAGVNAELHVFGKGSHGFGLGDGRGRSMAIWPTSFVAWLRDSNMIQD